MSDRLAEYQEPGSAHALARCLACAAMLPPDAPYCGTCGVAVAASDGGAAPTQPSSATPSIASAAHTEAPAAAHTEARTLEHGQQQVCPWCGAPNAATAARCAQCEAVFPLPDQDEALRRASESRVQVALTELEQRERKRSRSFLGRLFGG